jgi:small-conductance mechanosensitive channel
VLLDKICTTEHQLTHHLHQLSLEGLAVAPLLQFLHSLSTLLLVFYLKIFTHLQFPQPVFILIRVLKLFFRDMLLFAFHKKHASSYVIMAHVSVLVLKCVYLISLHSYLYYILTPFFLEGAHASQNLTLTNVYSNYYVNFLYKICIMKSFFSLGPTLSIFIKLSKYCGPNSWSKIILRNLCAL